MKLIALILWYGATMLIAQVKSDCALDEQVYHAPS